jgi:hypothetical protein
VAIGEWVDEQMERLTANIQVIPDQANMEYVELPHVVHIETMDSNGVMSWGRISAVTRHDPTPFMYRVCTKSGRSVTVVDSESLLVWSDITKSFQPQMTSAIRIGDCLPVSAHMHTPPDVNIFTVYNVTHLFPKSSYIYGTDWNTVVDKTRGLSKTGKPHWWNANQGQLFQLPHTSWHSWQIANHCAKFIPVNGCIYPYYGPKTPARIPERIPLDRTWGTMIGIYLADGTTDKSSVNVGNQCEGVLQFVESFFDVLHIRHKRSIKQSDIGHPVPIVRGNNLLLVTIMEHWAGHYSYGKHVPHIAFNGPDDFALGILCGYMSCDSSVCRSSITCSSVSRELTEGVCMLATKFNVFSVIDRYLPTSPTSLGHRHVNRLTIKGEWYGHLKPHLTLLNPNKHAEFRTPAQRRSQIHDQYPSVADVVLDPVVSIEKFASSQYTCKYPKVYDLTIPGTFNFGLANGLQVRDTGKSGYLQRRLVKKHEDVHIGTTGCLTNAHGEIVSFLHLDGWNPALIEHIPIQGTDMTVRSGVDIRRLFQQQVAQWQYADSERELSASVFGTCV